VSELTAATLAKWRADPEALSQALVMRRPDETLGPPQWSERQRTWLRALAAREKGAPRHRTVAVIGPKRSGKTLVSAFSAIWKSLGEDRRSVFLANSRESAQSLGFETVKELLARGPLAGTAEVQRGRIVFHGIGSEILAVPCSGRAVAGIGVSGLLVSDELWAADDPEPWRLLSSQTEGTEAQTLMVSQTSGTDSDVYRTWKASQENAPGLWVDYIGPADCEGDRNPNPYITAEFLAQRRAALPDALFRQYFLAAWGSADNTFLAADVLAGCDEDYRFPRTADDWQAFRDRFAAGGPVGVGAGLDRAQPFAGRDESALAFVAKCPGETGAVFRLVELNIMATGAEGEVLGCHKRAKDLFGRLNTICEIYQSADLAPKLGAELRHATGPAQVGLFSELHRLAVEGRLKWPAGPEGDKIRGQLATFRVDTSGPQPKFSGGSGKAVDDSVFGLAWGVQAAQEVRDRTIRLTII